MSKSPQRNCQIAFVVEVTNFLKITYRENLLKIVRNRFIVVRYYY